MIRIEAAEGQFDSRVDSDNEYWEIGPGDDDIVDWRDEYDLPKVPPDSSKGGPGSGNWGHRGRTGKEGGSVARGSEENYHTSNGNDEISAQLVKARGTLTEAEDMAVEKYIIESGYYNVSLRQDWCPPETFKLGKDIRTLDSALESREIPENILVYRGVRKSDFIPAVGETFADLGYVSTSLRKEKAMAFREETTSSREVRGGAALLRVKIDAGSKGMYLEGLSTFYGDSPENEVLLPRRSMFRVDDKGLDANNNYVIDLTYLGQ